MRQVIAQTVANDPEMFSEGILGKPNTDYCTWIQDDKSWGGAIELSILSNHYGFEIAVVDTINAIINRFGEDQHYSLRIFLMFDGIHYDPLFLESPDGGSIQTIFPTDDDKIMREAEELAREANSSRQFTDVNKFTLKCMNCDMHLSGQLQAREHAQSTGHMNFGEV
jgi:ubiquitin thioesterase OTU1